MVTTPEGAGHDNHVRHLIPALLAGTLAPAEAARVQEHLAQCTECQVELAEWIVVAAATEEAAPNVVAPAIMSRVFDRVAPLPAVAAPAAAASARRTRGFQMSERGRLGSIMAASLGVSALIASNSGMAQQVLLRNHIAAGYYQNTDGGVYSSSNYQFYGFQATHTAVPSSQGPTQVPDTGPAAATSTSVPSTAVPATATSAPGTAVPAATATPLVISLPPGLVNALTLPGNRRAEVNIPQGLLNALSVQIRNAIRINFNPAPTTQNEVQDGTSIGGNIGTRLSPPIDVQFVVRDPATGTTIPLDQAARDTLIEIALPLLVGNVNTLPPGSDFQWLVEQRDTSGQFLGYRVLSGEFDPGAGVKRYRLPLGQMTGTLFLPVILTQAWVQNHNPNVHIYSGPLASDADFGLAGPQFTTFTVVAPQIANRLYVFNPATNNYGWIDVSGVGPSGPGR